MTTDEILALAAIAISQSIWPGLIMLPMLAMQCVDFDKEKAPERRKGKQIMEEYGDSFFGDDGPPTQSDRKVRPHRAPVSSSSIRSESKKSEKSTEKIIAAPKKKPKVASTKVVRKKDQSEKKCEAPVKKVHKQKECIKMEEQQQKPSEEPRRIASQHTSVSNMTPATLIEPSKGEEKTEKKDEHIRKGDYQERSDIDDTLEPCESLKPDSKKNKVANSQQQQ